MTHAEEGGQPDGCLATPAAAPVCAGCGARAVAARCPSCGAAAIAGGYTVESLLAATPHGRVYRARGADGARVALKELVFAVAADAQTIDAFEREARLLEGLEHPAVPRFAGFFREGAGADLRLYLAQELVEGESLEQRISRRRLDESEARLLAEQVLEILAALHGRTPRLLHRDLKPANLILREGGGVALVDFGSARLSERGATHGATVVGTFGYAPLEQLGGSADERSDLYALGATLVHAVTGIPPAELLTPSFGLDFKRACGISPALRAFLERLTAARAAERPASAQAALELLRGASAPAKVTTLFPTVERWRDGRLGALSRAGSWGMLAVAGTAGLVLLLSAIGFVLTYADGVQLFAESREGRNPNGLILVHQGCIGEWLTPEQALARARADEQRWSLERERTRALRGPGTNPAPFGRAGLFRFGHGSRVVQPTTQPKPIERR